MKRILSIWIICLMIAPAFSQEISHTVRNFSISDGIPQSQVTSLIEDNLGYLWIGTRGGGLARFDGEEFTVYTTLDGLFSNVILDVWFDSNENLWLLHPRGFTRFDGATFTKIKGPEVSVVGDRALRLYEKDKTIRFLSYYGYPGTIVNDSVTISSTSLFGDRSLKRFFRSPMGDVFIYLSDDKIYTVGIWCS